MGEQNRALQMSTREPSRSPPRRQRVHEATAAAVNRRTTTPKAMRSTSPIPSGT